jgi:DNA-binding MarR family transcriptional regulator
MEKEREELLEKLFKEMICTFRSLRPEGHRFGDPHHHWGKHKFGRGHMDLFFRLTKEKEGISVKEIADSLHITPGAVSQIVDGVVKMGIVTRAEDPNDRRSQRIRLSEKAKSKIEHFKKNYFEKLGPRFANLTDEEICQLTSLLGKINQFDEKEIAHG